MCIYGVYMYSMYVPLLFTFYPPSLSLSLPLPFLSLSLPLPSFLLSSFYSQSYEGHFMLRRKSGSCIKQHIKLMPVRDSSGFVSHHVTIRRQLSSQEIRATMFNSGEGGRERGREGGREKYIYSTVHLQIEYF